MNRAYSLLTAERLRELLHYEPTTGLFTRRVSRGGAKAGEVAGGLDRWDYIGIKIDGRDYAAHRLAWLYMTGEWPAHEIDHRDRCRTNNRWGNLREATRPENARNLSRRSDNVSGVPGVIWHKARGKWRAMIRRDGIGRHLGLFDSIEAAATARRAAELSMFGEFAPSNRGHHEPCI